MHNRTSLVILTRMVSHFPTKSILGEKILDALEPLQGDNNPMQDIKAMAQAYSSQLVKARSEGVWREESEKATKEREEREKQVQEEKRLKREKNLEEMEKDSQEIFKNMERDGRDGRRRQDRPYRHNAPSQMQRMGNAHPHQRDRREQRQAPPPTSQGIQGRWERDKGMPQRAHDQGRRRDDNRDGGRDNRDNRDNRNQAGDNDSGKSLQGRWEGNNAGNSSNEGGRKSKRDPSAERNKSTERDPKRSRRDASPHRRHGGGRRR